MMQSDDGDDDAGSDDDAPAPAAPRVSDDGARLIDRKVLCLRAFDATELFTTTAAAAAAAADGKRATTVGMEGGAVSISVFECSFPMFVPNLT